jgi:hypothetical protein
MKVWEPLTYSYTELELAYSELNPVHLQLGSLFILESQYVLRKPLKERTYFFMKY